MNFVNYQKQLDQFIDNNQEAGIRPSLLMHSCCAPCSSYVLEYLSKYFDLTMYFYNPNMDSKSEYDYRYSELERLIGEMPMPSRVQLVKGEFEPDVFYQSVKGHECDPERGDRCKICYRLRLRKTAEYMKQHGGFDYFATTLTLSPLKDAIALNTIGAALAEEYEVPYLPTDFKKKEGYKRSIILSREYSLYRQNYCGCIYSKSNNEVSGGQL